MLDTFISCLIRVLLSLAFIIPGFMLCKYKKAFAWHLSTLSTILVYVCGPCMIIYAFYSASLASLEYNISKLDMGLNMLYFGLVTLFIQIIFVLILYMFFRRKYEDAKYRLLTSASVLGNVGFFGLPLVQAIVSNNPIVACYSSVYVMSMNILAFTVGVFCLTKDKKYISLKAAFINPTGIAILFAIPIFIFADKLQMGRFENEFWDAINLLGKMTTPMCMLILGIRLAVTDLKKLFIRPFVYYISGFKMIIFPIFSFFLVYFLPFFDDTFKASILILSSVPCASVILNLAEMHHAEEELAANCVLVSTLLCFISIPLLTLLINIL